MQRSEVETHAALKGQRAETKGLTMQKRRAATAVLVALAVLAVPNIAGARYLENHWQGRDVWEHAHIRDETADWEDNNNSVAYYDVEIVMASCRTSGGNDDDNKTVAIELRRDVSYWPDEAYGEEFYYCGNSDEHAWVGVDDNGTFFARLEEVMGIRSGEDAHLDWSLVDIFA